MKTRGLTRWLAGFVSALGTSLGAPVDVTSRTEITTANVRSTLNRDSGQITSSADITLKNVGDRPLEAPLHVALFFTPESGSLDGMQVPGSLGGIGAAPYQTFFFDLSASIGAGLAPQATTTLPLRFTPPKGTRVTFRIVPHATVDADPVARAGGPYQARAGTEVVFDGSSSSDPEGGALSFEWNFGDGSPTAPGAIARHSFGVPGLYEATLSVRDTRNHLTVVRVPVTISPAADFAVARVRTLDGAGLPLGGVAIEERRNEQPRNLSSSSAGFAPLGSGIGSYTWKFSKPGYLTVWRQGQLLVNQAAIISNPWLAKENGQKSNLSPLNNALLISPSQNVRALFNAGAFPQGGEGAITDLSAQTIPFPLPLGWSPIAQFHLGLTEPPAEAGAATLALPEALVNGQQAALVLYSAPTQRWEVRALVAGNGTTSVGAELLAGGSYALVIADAAPFIPPSAEIGQPLIGTTQAFEVGNVTATGSVTPDVSPASREAAAVTASARVVFTNPQPLPSGLFFPTRVSEKYALANERIARTPDYDTTVFAYHRPGSGLAAEFPMRPQLLFGPEELKEATVKCEVLAPGGFKGGVIDNSGGVLGGDGIRVTVPAGAVNQAQPAELTPLDPQPFAAGLPSGVTAIKAFAINLAELAEGKVLSIAIEGLEPSALYVLGRAVSDGAGPGVTPLERFASDGSGRLSSAEPSSGPRLPGARGPGDYVLLKINGPQALVQGVARDVGGNPAANLAIRSAGQPWLVFSAADGSYKTLASSGAAVLSVLDPRDGNEGSASITIGDPGQPQTLDLSAVPTGPRVVIVEPAVLPNAAASKVRTATPIVARFSEPIVSASFGANGMTVTKIGGGPVEGSLSLNLARTEAAFLPANPLDADSGYTITVSDTIRDAQNLSITGNRTFTFTTTKPATRGEGAQLVIYEPGADNVPAVVLSQLVGYSAAEGSTHVVAHGSAGTADPEVAVILVNQTTGETATVLSNADGSFANFLNADEEDFISALFVNANGTRVEVPASRQQFDDGRVGLYRAGGILEAESDGGRAQIFIEPAAVKSRTTFKVEMLGLTELLGFLNNTLPVDAQLLGGMKLEVQGDDVNGASEVSFPIDATKLNLPPGKTPEDGAFALAIARQVDGQTVYQTVDKLRYEDGHVRTNTFPFLGLFVLGALSDGADFYNAIIVPLFLGVQPVALAGRVVQAPVSSGGDSPVDFIPAGLLLAGTKPLPGAFIAVHQPGSATQAFFEPGGGLPGRLRPGLVYATSGPDGFYSLVLPSAASGYVVTATHPLYGERLSNPVSPLLDFSLAGVAEKDFIFKKFVGLGAPPKLSVAHTPFFPAPGQEVTLQIHASHGVVEPQITTTRVVSVKPLDQGGTAALDDVVIGDIVDESIGVNRKRRTAKVNSAKRVRAEILVLASAEQSLVTSRLFIDFGGVPPVGNNPIAPADPNDDTGPVVSMSSLVSGATLPLGEQVTLRFNEPIDKALLDTAGAVTLDNGAAPILTLSPDQLALTLAFPTLQPDTAYTLTVNTAVADLAGNALDQDPDIAGDQSYTLNFRTAPVVVTNLPGIQSGGGIVVNNGYAFALDRSDNAPSLKIFDISDPSAPTVAATVPLPSFPRDLVFIPKWSFAPGLGAAPVTRDLLAVVGGNAGSASGDDEGNVFFQGQYLRLFDVTNPAAPARVLGALLTLRPAVISKVRWKPPFLAYFENASDQQSIGVIDLQEMIIGFTLPQDQAATELGFFRRAGIDLNGDGDYVDSGERIPKPARAPPEFAGKVFSHVVIGTNQRIVDFDFDQGFCAVVLTAGQLLNPAGQPIGAAPPSYRTVTFNGLPVNGTTGNLRFGQAARPKRVTTIFGALVEVNGQTESKIISLVSLAPDGDGSNRLAVIDITLPESPRLLTKIALPPELGLPQSTYVRDDGLIALATGSDLILLDPRKIGAPQPGTGVHPAIFGVIPGAGSGNITLGGSLSGVNAINLGDRNALVQTAPKVSFVNFPARAEVVNPTALAVATGDDKQRVWDDLRFLRTLQPARFRTAGNAISTLSPPSPLAHYHVLIEAPGGAGGTIEVALESLNRSGFPLRNRGANFAPVRAMSDATLGRIGQRARTDIDAPIRPLIAQRLSDDKASPFYNRYLSRPFALTYEKTSIADLDALNNELERDIIWGGHFLRATIDPNVASSTAIGKFAAGVDSNEKILLPSAQALAETLPAPYIMGANPPPATGEMRLPGTFGTVSAHSGEFRTETVDLALPSPRMPIVFERVIGGQDTYEGPFGRGWDFAHNQQILELKETVFPGGVPMPVVVRSGQNSTLAMAKDVLLQNGRGRLILFKFAGEDPPPEIASDPLVADLGWDTDADAFYLPDPQEKGVFEIMVRFSDGQFARLTVDGMQFWYSASGRLERIYDRYPDNYHVLTYDERGALRRITDHSVDSDRYIEIGYYRLNSSASNFVANLDQQDGNVFVDGKIGKLRDYAGRDVLFFYDADGILERREGVTLDGANGGFAGRPTTRYIAPAAAGGTVQGVIAGAGGGAVGAPFFAASTVTPNVAGDSVVTNGGGAGGNVSITVGQNTTAETIDGATNSISGPDGSSTSVTFDENAQPKDITFGGGDPATYTTTYNTLGLVEKITYPEGNSVTYTYDVANASLRARGNLKEIKREPGGRGGGTLIATYNYDERYNLPSGSHTNFNGKAIDYAVTAEGRDVESISYGAAGTHSFTYNSHGQVDSETTPQGVSIDPDYNGSTGFPTKVSRGGLTTSYGYSGLAGDLGMPTSITLPRGTSMNAAYDARLMMTELARGSLVESRGYDENGKMVTYKRTVDGGRSHEELLEYDQIGFLTKVTVKGVEVNGSAQDLVTEFTPDGAFRVQTATLPGGEVRMFGYDSRGHLTSMTIGAYSESYKRDKHGNLVERTVGDVVSTYTYDGHDRLIEVKKATNAGDELTTISYFGGGEQKRITIKSADQTIVRDREVTDVDELGRPVGETFHGGQVSASRGIAYASGSGLTITHAGPRDNMTANYDAAGRLTGSRTGLADVTYVLDGNGNIESITSDEDGTTFTTSFTYDGLDHPTSESDLVGTRFSFTPREDGAIKQIIDARSKTTVQEFSIFGELLKRSRPHGIVFKYGYDANRQLSAMGDAGGGNTYGYDTTLRMDSMSLRDGSSVQMTSPDARNMPTTVQIPGGSMALGYDQQRRVLSNRITYGVAGYEMSGVKYDALNRVVAVSYGTNGSHSATFNYDKLGPLVSATYQEPGGPFPITYQLNSDGSRRSLRYPSLGQDVEEDREPTGRLRAVRRGGDIWNVTAFKGIDLPADILLGGVIREINEYDLRRRLLSRRYERIAGGLLAETRYEYDAADNQVARQFVHRHGRGDIFAYDDANRLTHAEIGARPNVPSSGARSASGLSGGSGLSPGFFARTFTYDAGGLDLLNSSPLINPDALPVQGQLTLGPRGVIVPAFTSELTGHDGYLHAVTVDGFGRGGSDPLGNVQKTIVMARLPNEADPRRLVGEFVYNGRTNLAAVQRSDGIRIEYSYRPDGLVHHRKVTQGGTTLSETALVWDGPFLIEEYDISGGSATARARYYYADEDTPVAADIDRGAGFQRFYYLRDSSSSIIAVADDTGQVRERVTYDAWGQPVIQEHDTAPPQVSAVLRDGNDLLVWFSEIIQPPVAPGAGPAFITQTGPLTNALSFSALGAPLPGQLRYEEALVGSPFGAVIRFTPSVALPENITLSTTAGALVDEWGNSNAAETRSFTLSGAVGNVLFQGTEGVNGTAPKRTARSAVGSPFLFHGQYFDYDAGLSYMRGRFYDPFTGQFLQRDPEQYRDSVNLYAAFGNNPVTFRDPSGRAKLPIGKPPRSGGRSSGRRTVAPPSEGAGVMTSEIKPRPEPVRPQQPSVIVDMRYGPATPHAQRAKAASPPQDAEKTVMVSKADMDAQMAARAAEDAAAERAREVTRPNFGRKPRGGGDGDPKAVDEFVSVFHGSIDNAKGIRDGGLQFRGGQDEGAHAFATRDRDAALDAINNPQRVGSGKADDLFDDTPPDKGLVESRIPRADFERVMKPLERDYKGFHGAQLQSSEIVLRTEESVVLFNTHIVK